MAAAPLTTLSTILPRGRSLDDAAFRRRHEVLCGVLGAHLPALLAFGAWRGTSGGQLVAEVALPLVLLYLALRATESRRRAAVLTTLGLLACSAVLVHLSGGAAEAHVHVFLVLAAVAVYQDWATYATALVAVLGGNVAAAVVEPAWAFGTGAAADDPWAWTAVHLLAVCGFLAVELLAWRAVEADQERSTQLAADLAIAQNQIDARQSVSELFVNLARRNQALLERQIDLIVRMEEREHDPDQLARLFQLDHLATRIRRNAESLLVLSGEEPARRWGRPVPLADVVRAAVAEVEEYRRTDIAIDEGIAVVGRAVADVAHLLAELIENGLQFSPPDSRVRIASQARPDGSCVVVVEDRGIGLSMADLAAANDLVASPPEVDLRLSKRLGFHVVARLAARYQLRVKLTPTAGGGVTAAVWMPAELLAAPEPVTTAPLGATPAAPAAPAPAPAPVAAPPVPLAPAGPTAPARSPLSRSAGAPGSLAPAPSAEPTTVASRAAAAVPADGAGAGPLPTRRPAHARADEPVLPTRSPRPAALAGAEPGELPAAPPASPPALAPTPTAPGPELLPEFDPLGTSRLAEAEAERTAPRGAPADRAGAPSALAPSLPPTVPGPAPVRVPEDPFDLLPPPPVPSQPEHVLPQPQPLPTEQQQPAPALAPAREPAYVDLDEPEKVVVAAAAALAPLAVTPRTTVADLPAADGMPNVFGGTTSGGLARRVPKQALQPQLRERAAAPAQTVPAFGRPAGDTLARSGRTPAELRSMLSKFQAAQSRARTEIGLSARDRIEEDR